MAEHVTDEEGEGALGVLAVEAMTDFTTFLGILGETEDQAFVTFETVGEWQGLIFGSSDDSQSEAIIGSIRCL